MHGKHQLPAFNLSRRPKPICRKIPKYPRSLASNIRRLFARDAAQALYGTPAVARTWNGVTLVNGLPVFENNEAPEGLSSPGLRMMQKLVPEIGIEPTTYALRMRRSTN